MSDHDLTVGSIPSHVRSIAVPASIGLFFNTMYNVVDTWYAGRISTEALAGMTIAGPIFFLVLAISFGIGNGATALSAIAIGKKDNTDFSRLLMNAVFLGVIVSVTILVAAPFLVPFLFRVSGSSGQEMALGIGYTNTIFYGALFFIMNAIINGFLNAQGDTKSYRNFLILGFLLNLFLDPLFIFGWFGLPKLGTVGVALATVIVQAIGTFYLTYRLIVSPLFDRKLFFKERPNLETIRQLISQGLPASLNMATIALGVFITNYFVLAFAPGPHTIAAYGASMRIEQIALLPALGLNTAALTIAGQNFGAMKYDRIHQVRRLALTVAVGMMVVAALIIYPFSPYFIAFFNKTPEVIAAGTHYLRIEAFALPTYVILNIEISILQAVKKPNFAIWVGLYRQILMPFILFQVLGSLLAMGITGVWWGIVFINWSATVVAIIHTRRTLSKVFA